MTRISATEMLALHGGTPVRAEMLAYGHQMVTEADVKAVVEVLRSPWLTTGPAVAAFEMAFASTVGSRHAVAVSSGTAALHAAAHALGVGPGDEVIVPAITFVASANCVVFEGGTPVFADVDPQTLLLDPASVESRRTSRTKAVVAVDYAGQPCDYGTLRPLAERMGLRVIADACHALGAVCGARAVGGLADLTTFSFHPVKHITTGEGGMIATDDEELANRMRVFRNHGITSDHRQRESQGAFFYEMVELGYNYRLTDFQCALGMAQLVQLPAFLARRRDIAAQYHAALAELPEVELLTTRPECVHSYHLYVIKLRLERLRSDRSEIFRALRAEGIGVNVHYSPVHLHPFYRHRFGTRPGLCPVAEREYERLITLPLFPAMSDRDADDVIEAVHKVIGVFRL
jgi:perosamine synthetase